MSAPSFFSLIQSFAERKGGLQVTPDGLHGLTFECDGLTLRVLPHPTDESSMWLEVDVCDTQEHPAKAWRLLHQLNYVARFDQGWTIGLDLEQTLVLSASAHVAHVNADSLEELMVDGLTRAQALLGLWRQLCASEDVTASALTRWADLPPGVIKV
jgi:hypothetical protein